MLKKILIGVALFIVLLGTGVFFLKANIVRSAIEKYGTAATQTDVTLDKVSMTLSTGKAALTGLSIGSPKGFKADKSFYLGDIAVKLDTSSITGNGPIVIEDISIEKPQIAYEINKTGESNLQTIMRSVKAYSESSNKGKNTTEKSASANKQERKIIINNLTVRDGQIAISHSMLEGKKLSTGLPVIHLTNIGKNEGGTTPAVVIEKVLGAITNSASKVASSKLAKELGATIRKTGKETGDKIKGYFE
ncbi:MAG: AsmA family protein [Bdellovibrionales bacterium]|jgi:hypothetical protein